MNQNLKSLISILLISGATSVLNCVIAQIATFPYGQGFESTFASGINAEFIPGWTGNEVTTGSTRIFRDGVNQLTGSGSLGIIPITTFNGEVTLNLNFSTLSNVSASFWARTAKNSTGTRPAIVNFYTSTDGGTSYSAATLIGTPVSFPNENTAYSPYSFNFPSSVNGKSNVRLKMVVSPSTDSSGTTARFIMDDFLITGTTIVDTVPPAVSLVSVVSSSQLDIRFTEAVSLISAQNTINYAVDNGIGQPITAVRDGSDFSLVHLTFPSTFATGTPYQITITNIEDLFGNKLLVGTGNFALIVTAPRDVIINEIMADPDPIVGLPNFEYVELFNRSSFPVNLNNWTFTAGATTKTFTNLVIQPGEFLLLSTATAATALQQFGNVTPLFTSSTTLTNGGTTLMLKDPAGMIVNAVTYSDTWYQDAGKKDGGWSLELINPENPCPGIGNWRASVDLSGGTPGKINSIYSLATDTIGPKLISVNVISATSLTVCFDEPLDSATATVPANYWVNNGIGSPVNAIPAGPGFDCVTLIFSLPFDTGTVYNITVNGVKDCRGNPIGLFNTGLFVAGTTGGAGDVIINEIMADPDPPVGLPNFEYLELYNRTALPINLNNYTLTVGSTTRTFSNVTIMADSFLLVSTATAAPALQPFGPVAAVFTSSTTLTNGGAVVTLRAPGGLVVNSITYSDTWYQDAGKKDGGWSIERINPLSPCSGASNWRASADPSGGTPGRRNSIYSAAPDTVGPSLKTVEVNTNVSVTVCFSESLDSLLAANPAHYSVSHGLGNPVAAIPAGPNFDCVTLLYTTPFDTATIYTLNVSGVRDCMGNLIGAANTGTIVIGLEGDYRDIIINEIMADPDPVVGLPSFEYLELYNRSGKPVSLGGWTITAGATVKALPVTTLLADSFLLLSTQAAMAELQQFGAVQPIFTSSTMLTNGGTTLSLRNQNNRLIDQVTYSDTWYRESSKSDGGWSLERKDVAFPCSNSHNWGASIHNSGGTPGHPNSIKGTFIDHEKPTVLRAAALNSGTVKVVFSEAMDTALLFQPSMYNLSPGIGSPVAVFASDSTLTSVTMILPAILQQGTVYTVNVNFQLKDCPGNPMNYPLSARFGIAESADPSDLILNEILFNPNSGGSDYVEIFNRSLKVIDLKNFVIANANYDTGELVTKKLITDESFQIVPGDYVVLTSNVISVMSQYQSGGAGKFISLPSMPSYNNDKGFAVLLDPSDVKIDQFRYSEKMHFPLLNSFKGVSLEKVNPNRGSADSTNWHSAASNAGYGTPGLINSQYSTSVSLGGTVTIDPEIFSPDNDGHNDVVNILYAFDLPGAVVNITIYDAGGRQMRHLLKNELTGTGEGIVSWDGVTDTFEKARLGIYIILVEAFTGAGEQRSIKKTCVLGGRL